MPSARRTGTNERIFTYGPAASSPDYIEGEMGIWEAFTDTNLVTAQRSEVLEIIGNVSTYQDTCRLQSATTNAAYFRIIRPQAPARHLGHFWDHNSARFNPGFGLDPDLSAGVAVFQILENFSQIQDVIAEGTWDTDGFEWACVIGDQETDALISQCEHAAFVGCEVRSPSNIGIGADVGGFLVLHADAGTRRQFLVGCLALDCTIGFSGVTLGSGEQPGTNYVYCYNCQAIANSSMGWQNTNTLVGMINCVAENVGTDVDWVTLGNPLDVGDSRNNATSDATAPGPSSRTNQTFTFENDAGGNVEDWRLHVTDAGANDFGVDLSDDVLFPFFDDIGFNLFSTWDIGYRDPQPQAILRATPARLRFRGHLEAVGNAQPLRARLHFNLPPTIRATTPPFPPNLAAVLDTPTIVIDWLVEAPTIGLKWSYHYNPDGTWSHRMVRLGDLDARVEPGGGIGATGTLQITAVEDGTSGSLLRLWETAGFLEGAPITLKALIDPLSAVPTWLTMFRGRIDRTEFANGIAELTATDDSLQRNILLPSQVVTSAAYPVAPETSIGRAIQLVYGEAAHIPALPLLQVNTSTRVYLAAHHAFASGPTDVTDTLAAWDDTTQTYQYISEAVSLSLLSAPAGAQVFRALPDMRFNFQSATRYGVARQQDVTQPGRAFDGNVATFARLATSTFSQPLEGIGFLGVYVSFGPSATGVNTTQVSVAQHRRNSNSDTRVTGQFSINILDGNRSAVQTDLVKTIEFRHASKPRDDTFTFTNLAIPSNHYLEIFCRAINEGGLGSAAQYYEWGDLFVRSWHQVPGDGIGLFVGNAVSFTGRRDEAALFTGTFQAPLTNVAAVIQSILVSDIGIPFVDTLAFSHVRTASRVSGWRFDGGLGAGWAQEQYQGRDFLDILARLAGCAIYLGLGGVWRLQALGQTDPAVLDIQQQHILFESPEGTAQSRSSSFKVIPGSMELIFNEYEVRYRFNVASRNYERVRYVRPTETNVDGVLSGSGVNGTGLQQLCANSRTRYGAKAPLVIEAPFIGADSMAETVLDFLVRYFWSQRVFVELLTTWRALGVQLGETVTVTHPLLPSQVTGAAFEVHRKVVSPTNGTVRLEASRIFVVSVDYWAMEDINDVTWYFWVDAAGALVSGQSSPLSSPFLEEIDITGTADNLVWLLVTDVRSASDAWISADTSGTLQREATEPATGAGETGRDVRPGLVARGLNGILYRVQYDSGTGTVAAQPLLA